MLVGVLAALCAVTASCSSTAGSGSGAGAGAGAAAAEPRAPEVGHPTVWLCRPSLASDPCRGDLDTTEVAADGSERVVKASSDTSAPIDCFYVYPTVSLQPTGNADLTVDPVERAVAVAQAARFSQVCRVYAPMYRQVTDRGLLNAGTTKPDPTLALDDVEAAWQDYLAHDNHGRGVVLIGHSQGSFVLRSLIQRDIDPVPAVRRLLVSAILLGGNIQVRSDGRPGGDFAHLGPCHSLSATGCLVGYSSFAGPPPPDSLFGRTSVPGDQVLCVNPADPAANAALALADDFPTRAGGLIATLPAGPSVGTPWISYPDRLSGQCRTQGDASWLQITPIGPASDTRPVPTDTLGPTWGLHLVDMNVAVDDLVTMVRHQSASWRATSH